MAIFTKQIRTILSILAILLSSQIFAQSFYLNGKVSDAFTGESLPGANIKVQGTPYGTSSNSKGEFNVKVEQVPATLVVSFIGYETEYYKISGQQKPVQINLTPKIYLLDSINVSADRIINIIKDKPLYVWDYEIFEDKLLMLAFEENSMFRPRLILMTFDGDTVCTRSAKGAKNLYKDCLDNVHVIGKNEFHQIYFDGTQLQLLYPNPIINIKRVLDPCYEFHNGKYIVFKFFKKRQIIQYFTIDPDNPIPREFATYWDSLGLVLQLDTQRFKLMNVSRARFDERRWLDEFVFDPIFAPLAIVKDKIYVFDYTNDKLEQLNNDGTLNHRTKIDYHHLKNWQEELLVDDALGKTYTIFLNDGLFTLHEINLDTGELGPAINIPDYPFIQKMQVYDGYLYFIYKEKNYDEYKKLFKMLL